MRLRRVAVWIAFVALVAIAGFVRLAPVDPARWHVDLRGLAAELASLAPGEIRVGRNSAAVRLRGLPDSSAPDLAALDAVALAHPRTRRIAGSVEDRHITWESRSLIWGFPDYITAQLVEGDLVILARSRFGDGDWGVNAARLRGWLSQL